MASVEFSVTSDYRPAQVVEIAEIVGLLKMMEHGDTIWLRRGPDRRTVVGNQGGMIKHRNRIYNFNIVFERVAVMGKSNELISAIMVDLML